MSRRLFEKLQTYLEEDLRENSTTSIPIRDKIAIYLLFVGSGNFYKSFLNKGKILRLDFSSYFCLYAIWRKYC
jgi:hypothetical protein